MKRLFNYLLTLLIITSCARQPTLPADSKYNVTSQLNDSTWFGTGKVLRLRKSGEMPETARQFNLVVFTDIDYQGIPSGPNPNTENGCVDPECTKTQTLVMYNIPLKKRKYSIARLNKRKQLDNEFAALWYIGNAGGTTKRYSFHGGKPNWVRVNRYDKAAGIVEGSFRITFRSDSLGYADVKQLPEMARFNDGLFRIKITDVLLR